VCLALLVCSVGLSQLQTFAQEESAPTESRSTQSRQREDIDLEVQLQILIGANGAASSTRLPSSLEGTLRQLRSTLPFESYRAGAAFLYRVRNGRSIDARGTGNVMQVAQINNPYTPSFYRITLRPVELRQGAGGREMVNVNEFTFGLRVPLTTSYASAGAGSPAQPVVQYEETGVTTGLTIAEGEPVAVGTIYFGSANEAIVVVLTVKRISPR
jgi:hypothetical protein